MEAYSDFECIKNGITNEKEVRQDAAVKCNILFQVFLGCYLERLKKPQGNGEGPWFITQKHIAHVDGFEEHVREHIPNVN